MPQITCPQCTQKITVAISQAGSSVTCASCQAEVAIPTLGELRRLAEPPVKQVQGESNAARRIVFAILMLIGGTAAVAGLFSAIRYWTIEVSGTSEIHIAELARAYKEVPASQLVREWQQMEKLGLDVSTPYTYKKQAIEKARWGRNGIIGLIVFALSAIVAATLGISDSRRKIGNSNLKA